jgi:peroxiredoxin Q/BCP
MPNRLATGDIAPDFTLPAIVPADADGPRREGIFTLSEHRGESVVLYAYPAAGTPGCTREADDFEAALGDLAAAGHIVVGLSPDAPAKLEDFAARRDLSFPLLSDPDHAVLAAYGAYGEKQSYGRTVVGVIRSTFVIGPDGKLGAAHYGVKATGHVARLRAELGIAAG